MDSVCDGGDGFSALMGIGLLGAGGVAALSAVCRWPSSNAMAVILDEPAYGRNGVWRGTFRFGIMLSPSARCQMLATLPRARAVSR